MNFLVNLDTSLTERLVLSPDSGWRQAARIIAHLGDGPYVFGTLALGYLWSWVGSAGYLRRAILITMFIVLTALLIVTLLKFLIRRKRPRPPGEFVTFKYDAYSFPSGHSARLAALAISMIFFFPDLGWPLVILAFIVAMARIAVGVHYVSDTLAGLGTGAVVAWEAITLLG